ncbi:SIR2-domain-containing protein [Leucogyrophana mollusca]|uniref:SIR2-domain-containing protein n=1 Tax=Leucogyrophana mollusca TaxID=85980 RepID=A0ACB8BIE9_9AGAM|nr:SIR2-domain-containing protein [Leucogyrophana mollusca]
MSSVEPAPQSYDPGEDTPEKTSKQNPIYALQLRAFLDAAEDVDADQDVIEDLLEGVDSASDGDVTELHDFDSENEDGDIEIDTSALYELEQEAQQAWTKDEIRRMMHHLKEHGMSSFVKEYVITRNIPIVKLLFAFGIYLCPELRNKHAKTMLYFLRVAMSRELHLREKLPEYNTISDAVSLIRNSRRIVVLTGAGISVSCGIPDFRSRDGLYASLKDRGEYDLDDPQQMFDIHYFRENPAVFYSFASQIYPSNFIPSPCHRFIKVLEDKDKLLRNYTQNIDTLETLTGITRVLQCHGSFKTATCLLCRRQVPGVEIERDILAQKVPYCATCLETHKQAEALKKQNGKKKSKKKQKKNEWDDDSDESDDLPVGVMKPDITFFGEKLTDDFDHALIADRDEVDLLLVIGTSLKVSPVSEILSHLPHSVPQILINKTPIRHINPDIVLLGNADDIVQHLCDELEWDLPPPMSQKLPPQSKIVKRSHGEMHGGTQPTRVGSSHVWLFEGAEGGKWVENILEKSEAPSNGNIDGGPEAKKPRIG